MSQTNKSEVCNEATLADIAFFSVSKRYCADRRFSASPLDAKAILILSLDVPAWLDYYGPSAAIPASLQGMVSLMEPLVSHAAGPANDTGVPARLR